MKLITLLLSGMALFLPACTAHGEIARSPYVWRHVTIKANGFINGIVYSPAAPGVLFMHTDMGGAYRWDADAARWVCLTDWATSADPAAKHMGVETMAVDPTDAGRAYMAVGTYMSPTAILRSSDGGRTWARTDVPFCSNGNGSARNTGQRMIVDPNAPNLLYYGTRADGLWRSNDYGQSWSRLESFPTIGHNSGWGQHTGIIWLRVDAASGSPGTPSPVVYAGVFEIEPDRPRIYRSTDAGATWHALPGGQPTDTNVFPQRCALTPDGTTLYLTYSHSDNQYPGPWGVNHGRIVKITQPAGDSPTWNDITPSGITAGISAVAIDPTDPSIIYFSELGNYAPADRIFRSTDAGDTWTAMHPNAHRDDASAPYVKSFTIHWLGDLQIDPHDRNVAMFTTGYGLYRTTNLLDPEPTWAFFNEGFEQSAALELASPSDGPVHLISAIGDRDGYRHDDFDVSPRLGGLGSGQGLARGTSPDIDVATRDSRFVVRLVNAHPFVQYSLDNAITWHWMPDPPPGIRSGGNIALSADGARIAWSPHAAEGEKPGVLFARRDGDTWSAWQQATVDEGSLDGVTLVPAPDDADVMYAHAGTSAFRSSDGGATWQHLTDSAPRGLRWIRAAPGRSGHLWAAGHDDVRLWRTTDGGATWSRVQPQHISRAYVLAVGPSAGGGDYPSVYIGGTIDGAAGIFRSDDQGQTWTEITDPDHHYGYLTVIQADPRVPGRIYLGTNGRGIAYGDPQ